MTKNKKMKVIKLTGTDEKPVYVIPNNIVYFKETGEKVVIYFNFNVSNPNSGSRMIFQNHSVLHVKESVEHIAGLING